jgi:eukaryotic-like serine/threonine-protein kinase
VNLQDIQSVLGTRTPPALDEIYRSYRQAQPDSNMDQFVMYLVESKKITATDLQELHLLEPIEVTHIDLLSQSHLLEQQLNESPVKTQHLPVSEQYDFLGLLGQGAMGLVHKAKDKDLQRIIAYKQLLQEMAQNRGLLRRFLNEVQITAQLDHPNIVPIYNLDIRSDGSLAYAMKLVRGKTFKELITEAKDAYDLGQTPDQEHSLETLLEHFLKVCDAMAYAHNKQVIHRDLKPANIMVGEYNEVYVMDWGIAKLFKDEKADEGIDLGAKVASDLLGEETQLGQIVGTPRYMSPQQAAGKNNELDGASDQFSLGLILFELVTLKPAFTAKSQIELLKKVLKSELEPYQHYHNNIKLPKELHAIILKATGRKAALRYATTADLAKDLRRYLRGEEIEALPDNWVRKSLRWIQKHKKGSAFTVMSLLGLSAAITVSMTWLQQKEIKASHLRESILSSHLTEIASKSQRLDSEFLKVQSLLTQLVATAEFSLSSQVGQSDKVYFNPDFDSQVTQPPDFANSLAYHRAISVDWAGVKLAPGVKAASVAPALSQLSGLNATFQRVFAESTSPPLKSTKDLKTALLGKGLPLVWAYIGLEQGIHFAYPGKGGYKESYDPRLRPWYISAKNKQGAIWGTPYLDASGQGLLLPCVQALYKPSQQAKTKFLGVAGVELSLENWLKELLPMAPAEMAAAGVENIYLLNQAGEIVVQTAVKTPPPSDGKLKLPLYTWREIREQFKHSQSGHRIIQRKDKAPLLVAYTRLNSIGWYYVIESNSQKLFKS